MSVDQCQLREMQRRMRDHNGPKVTYFLNTEGVIDAVYIAGAGIKKAYWDSVLSAAEFMRQYIVEKEVTALYGGTAQAGWKRQFSHGRWRD